MTDTLCTIHPGSGLPKGGALSKVYKPLRTFIALVGLEIWSSRDLISVTPPAGANLDAFMRWRNTELLKRKKHDNAHLIRLEQNLLQSSVSTGRKW